MQNLDRDHAGMFRPLRIGLFAAALAALAIVFPVSPATASLRNDAPSIAAIADITSRADANVDAAADENVQLAGNEHRGGNYTKPPARGSSAELHGGTSADRYGGSSADRRGVAGRYDTRNRSVHQFSANDRKRESPRPKQKDELDDQDQDPPRDLFSFTPPDPAAAMDRSDRD